MSESALTADQIEMVAVVAFIVASALLLYVGSLLEIKIKALDARIEILERIVREVKR